MLKTVTQSPRPMANLKRGSFETFYEVHHQAVYRPLSVSLRDASLAREATDEAFVRAYERWDVVKEYDNPPGWVYRVALNWARSKIRRRRFEVVGEPPTVSSVDGGFDSDLDQALGRLGLDDRAMVVLKHLAGWTYDEIADALGLKPGTVKSRLHRVVAQLRTELEVRP